MALCKTIEEDPADHELSIIARIYRAYLSTLRDLVSPNKKTSPPPMTHASTLDDQVASALQKSPHLLGQNLRSDTRDGHVVLHGSVKSYFHKQMAQEAIRRIDGVRQIANELVVIHDAETSQRAHFAARQNNLADQFAAPLNADFRPAG
jgi:hypothetical protein